MLMDRRLVLALPVVFVMGASATALAGPANVSTDSPASSPTDGTTDETISVSDIKPGMEGYGLTVFSGTTPERFNVKVLGVWRNFLPKQDVILIRSDDPRLVYSGIVKGMSGSPVYLDGKLAGAVAYAWPFAKDAIGGVTPIENMQAELQRPLRGPDSTLMAQAGEVDAQSWIDSWKSDPYGDRLHLGAPSATDAMEASAAQTSAPTLFEATPLTARPLLDGASAPRLIPAAVPIMASGLTPGGIASLQAALQPYGVEVMAGGGGGEDPSLGGPSSFDLGGSIGVELTRGDVTLTGVGTVTWVNGPHVLGFGHQMFGAGEVYLPISTVDIHTVLAAVDSSFKMGTPVKELGTLTQDRQACIVGDTSQKAQVVPVDVTVTGVGPEPQVFHSEVVRHKFLTPVFAEQVVQGALADAVSDVAAATITVDGTLHIEGYAPLEFVDTLYSTDGVSATALSQVRAITYLAPLLFNPFKPLELDAVDLKIDVQFKAMIADVATLTLSEASLPPGGRVNAYVTLHQFGAPDDVVTVPLDVPADLQGQTVKVTVDAGSEAKPDVAPPQNLDQLIDSLRQGYPGNSLVVALVSDNEGVDMDGQVIPDLPPSALDTLRPLASSDRGDQFHTSLRVVVPTSRVTEGHQEVAVRVRDDRGK
jgi:hypothetical protein